MIKLHVEVHDTVFVKTYQSAHTQTFLLGTICYDDGCHLKRYACNPVRSTLTTISSRISAMNFAIDRMHFKGHVDPWCHENCDPNKFKELDKVGYHLAYTIY